jgi:transmembrane sensor
LRNLQKRLEEQVQEQTAELSEANARLNNEILERQRANDRERRRQAWLEKGEAFFQIHHDAAHPFTVTAGDHKITDLGTKFSVRQERGRLRVTLLEGKARLDSTDIWSRRQSVELSPGDVAIATASSLSLVRKSDKALHEELGWRRGVLVFDRTRLADAVAEINRYNTRKLVIDDPAVAKLTLDGTFPVHAVPEFIEVAQAVFGLRVERLGDRTLISK